MGDKVKQKKRWFLKAEILILLCLVGFLVVKSEIVTVNSIKAAEQGDANAQWILGVMYYKDQGVTADYIEAYKWFLMAAASGNENAMSNKSMLQEKLTSYQIAEAQRLAKEFKPRAAKTVE